MTGPDGAVPYRVVDAGNQGWHGGPDNDWGTRYTAAFGLDRGLEDRTWEQLQSTRGPLRPVLPVTDEDADELTGLFDVAGRKTITTVAAALEQVFHQVREQRKTRARSDSVHESFEYARRTLLAGREGSWESQALFDVVLFGNGLNLAPASKRIASSIEARRKAGPARRVHKDVRDQLGRMLTRWVTGPGRYTEVAETLAAAVSRYCDEKAGERGWAVVADQWLQPGGLAVADFKTCYGLFYSLSEHQKPLA